MKTGFEPGSTGLGGDCSVKCTTITVYLIKKNKYVYALWPIGENTVLKGKKQP